MSPPGLFALMARARRNLWDRPLRQVRKKLGQDVPDWLEANRAAWKKILSQSVQSGRLVQICEIGSDASSIRWLLRTCLRDQRSKFTCIGRKVEGDQIRNLPSEWQASLEQLEGETFDLIFLNSSHPGEIHDQTLRFVAMLSPGGMLFWGHYADEHVRRSIGRACAQLGIVIELHAATAFYRKPAPTGGLASRRAKVVGLVSILHADQWMRFCLRALSKYVDAIIVSDRTQTGLDAVLISEITSFGVEQIIHRGTRTQLIAAGRKADATHFVELEGNEALTANFLQGDLLRNCIFALSPGQELQVPVFALWRGMDLFRPRTALKTIAFCEGEERSGGFGASKIAFPSPDHGVLSFQLVSDQGKGQSVPESIDGFKLAKRNWLYDYGLVLPGIPDSVSTHAESIKGRNMAHVPSQKEFNGVKATFLAASPHPLVSVIVPTQNRPAMLKEALLSILNQTLQDFEIIVVNDGGADIAGMLKEMGPKITYVRHEKPLERSNARNTGIVLSRGEYIAYLDDDDIFYPHHLESLLISIRASGTKIVYSDAYAARQMRTPDGMYAVVDRQPAPVREWSLDEMLVSNFIPTLCILHEKSCVDKAGFFDATLSTHEDWDLWLRMSLHFQFAHLQEITCEYRLRSDATNTTTSNRADFLRTATLIHNRFRSHSGLRTRKRQKAFLEGLRSELEQSREIQERSKRS